MRTLLLFAIIFLILFSLAYEIKSDPYQINITLSPSVVWWNDTVNASGYTFSNTWVQVNSSGTTICNLTSNTNGFYSCLFNAPLELGEYNYITYALDSSGSILAQDSTNLTVKVVYGGTKATKNIDTMNFPILIQDVNGKIHRVNVYLKVWG